MMRTRPIGKCNESATNFAYCLRYFDFLVNWQTFAARLKKLGLLLMSEVGVVQIKEVCFFEVWLHIEEYKRQFEENAGFAV